MGHLVKIFYGNERVHYEVWTNRQRGLTEIGLHFEDGPVSTAAYLRYFDTRIVALKHELGPALELERWTTSWGHLFEVAPLEALDQRVARRTAHRLAAMINVLQPLVAEADIPPERSAQSEEWSRARRRWRGTQR